MRGFWNLIYRRRTFITLLVLLLPLFMGQTDCNPSPNLTCEQNISFDIERGRCTIISPPCSGFNPWRTGDHYELLLNLGTQQTTVLSILPPVIYTDERVSNGTILRRVCSLSNSVNGNYRGVYEYTYQTSLGRGNFFLSVFDEGLLFVRAKTNCAECPHVKSGQSLKIVADAQGGTPPYSYTFMANGVTIPTVPNSNELSHNPNVNTEYTITVTDGTMTQVTDTTVAFVVDNPNQPYPTITTSPSGIILTNQTVSLTPAGSSNITKWQWDFDWKGNDSEPFELTINGSNGATTINWTTIGTKYIRLRATDAQGNFGETFIPVRVTNG